MGLGQSQKDPRLCDDGTHLPGHDDPTHFRVLGQAGALYAPRIATHNETKDLTWTPEHTMCYLVFLGHLGRLYKVAAEEGTGASSASPDGLDPPVKRQKIASRSFHVL